MNSTLTDRILVERAQRGDDLALDELIRRHQDRAYRYAFRLTRDSELAADTVANAFVRVHRSIGSFKGEAGFSTWLYRIVTNCYLDSRKRQFARQTVSLDTLMAEEGGDIRDIYIVDESQSAFDEALRGARNTAVGDAMEDIPDHHRAILVMYHLESLSYEEIADTLKLPMGTVKSRLNRARQSLALEMGERKLLFDESEKFYSASAAMAS